jgi:hypothetical protein
MRVSLNHANVSVVAAVESRAGVVPVWSGDRRQARERRTPPGQ